MAPGLALPLPRVSGDAAAILVAGLRKRYRTQQVLAGVDLRVPAGECFALVGVNGAGKTTLIKALLDFCAIDAGRIEVFGIGHRHAHSRQRLAYLPERFLPPYYLSGDDFLAYAARLYGASWSAAAIDEMFAALDLDPAVLPRPVREYSKGMAQKLGLAACFLSDRDLFVLDEPMSGLDPKARLLVKRQVTALGARGRTVFFSTHMLADVDDLCERMAVLHAGRAGFIGTPGECREKSGTSSLEDAYLACISSSPDG